MSKLQRSAILAVLQQFYCPVQVEDVNAYTAVFVPDIGRISELAKMLKGEADAWRLGELGPTWMCPALTDAEAVADPTYLTRSDWGIGHRLLIQGGDQARHLWLVRVFSDRCLVAAEQGLQVLSPIISRVRYHTEAVAFHLPVELVSHVSRSRNKIDEYLIEELREAAEDSHAALIAKEQPARRRLAQQLEHLDEHRRLFGNIFSS